VSERPKVLLIDVDETCRESLRRLNLEVSFVEQPLNLDQIIEAPLSPSPLLIICGAREDFQIAQLNELAQALRGSYPNCPSFLTMSDRRRFHRKDFQKNGFTEAFLLPADITVFQETLKLVISEATKGQIKFYKSVNVVDIVPEAVLDFDLYIFMPTNKKYVKYSSATRALDAKRAERLARYQVASIYVTTDQLPSFYKFTAEQLRKLGQEGGMSSTEREAHRERAVRDLLTGLFHETSDEVGFEQGRETLNDCKEIVKSYISYNQDKSAWYEKLMASVASQDGAYNRAANVATYAALFRSAWASVIPKKWRLSVCCTTSA
jgi:hypothetical protein